MRYVTGLVLACMLAGSAWAAEHVYQWQRVETKGYTHQWALLDLTRPVGVRQIGLYDSIKDEYSPLVNDKWGAPDEPPADAGLPPGCVHKPLPTGVIANKLPTGDHAFHNGQEISKDEAMALLAGKVGPVQGGGKIPDDSTKMRISVIGSTKACAEPMAVAKKHPEFVSVEYRPDAWMIQRQGFATPTDAQSDPQIYIQEPGNSQAPGKTIRRLEGWRGAEAFEKVLEEVIGRKVSPNPNYDKGKDIGWDNKKPGPSLPPLTLDSVPWVPLLTVGGLLAYALWSRRRKVA